MKQLALRASGAAARRGSALVIVVLFLVVLGGLAASLAAFGGTLHKEHARGREYTKSFYLAEAGLNEAYAHLLTNGEADVLAMAYPADLDKGSYLVETVLGSVDPDLRLDRLRMRAVANSGRYSKGVQLMIWKVPTGFFRWAAFGDTGVKIDSNSMIDSFDSKDGPYDHSLPWVGDFGNVGSNADIVIDSNSSIYGDAIVGPVGALDDSSPGIVVSGMVAAAEVSEVFDPIVVPAIGSMGSLNVVANTTLAAGDYHFTSLEVSPGGTFTLQGPARIVLDDAVVRSNSKWVIDATNGPVEIYAEGDFDLRSNSTVTSIAGQARDISVFITSTNSGPGASTIALNSNSDFVGTIYAPNADLVIESNFELYGAVRAGSVTLNSNTQLHFDEDLLYDPGVPLVYERLSWRPLSASEVSDLGF